MDIDILLPEIKEDENTNLFEKVQKDFLGLETNYQIASGDITRRIYLDSTASTLMMGIAHRTGENISSTLLQYSFAHALQCKNCHQNLYMGT